MGNWIKSLFSKRSDALAASAAEPAHGRPHQEQGDACFRDGDFAAAAEAYRQALEVDPDLEVTYAQLCFALCQLGQWDEARSVIEAGIARFAQSAELRFFLGNVDHSLGQWEQAAGNFRAALALDPMHASAWINLSTALQDQEKWEEALAAVDGALRLDAGIADWHLRRGYLLQKQGLHEEALQSYRQVLALEPDLVQGHINMGSLFEQMQLPERAVQAYRAALALRPGDADLLFNIGSALHAQQSFDESMENYRQALSVDPDHAKAMVNLGRLLELQKKYHEALACYEHVLLKHPELNEVRLNTSSLLLRMGRFREGWQEFECRNVGVDVSVQLGLVRPQWKGEDIAGKTIIVYGEQGFGDMLQFMRYTKLVAARGATVYLMVPPPLQKLAAGCAGVAGVLWLGDTIPPFDYSCPLMSLPLACGTEVDTIPGEVPYLHCDPARVAHWREKLGPKSKALRIGLAWAGNPRKVHAIASDVDRRRSMRFETLVPLLDIAGVEFYSLQVGEGADGQADRTAQLIDFTAALTDFQETAALIDNLDLVITVDTSVVHLSGALGQQTWMMDRFDHCYRWLLEREDSPWYPSLRIFRQPTVGDWDGVVLQVYRELCLLLFSTGRIEEALVSLQKGVTHFPDAVELHFYLGNLLAHEGKSEEAIASFRRVLTLYPEFAEAQFNLGNLYHQSGNGSAALECFAEACRLNPGFAAAHNNMGVVYREQGRQLDARACFERALQANPDFAEARNNLGNVHLDRLELEAAVACFRQTLAQNPEYADAHSNLGIALRGQGKLEASLAALRDALAVRPDHAQARWTMTFVRLQLIAEEEGEEAAFNRLALAELDELSAWCDRYAGDGSAVPALDTLFFLAGYEINCRAVLSRYGDLCARLMQAWLEQQHVVLPERGRNAKLKVGIVSPFFHEHPVWNAVLRGWYQYLDRDSVEFHSFYLDVKSDSHTAYARSRSASFAELGGKTLRHCVQAILDSRPDILIYPSIGGAQTQRLASLRLAPVQVATWGHPEGSGLPTIDYFLSAEDFEAHDAQAHYAERLVCLPHLGCTYPPLPVDEVAVDVSGSGIRFDVPVLLCPGMPYKYAPGNDHVLVEIAKRLGRCQLVFFTAVPPEQSERLKRRLEQAFARAGLNFADYGLFITWQSPEIFFALMRRAHVFLDTLGYSGFNTAMQALQCALPIVTREGRFLRGRFGSGILARMGMADTVAKTDAEYVDLALRLAQDGAYRESIRQRYRERSAGLYDDMAPSRALDAFLAALRQSD